MAASSFRVRPECGAPPACVDGQDNDGDNVRDYPQDPGCTSFGDVSEQPETQCNDGIDNDGDGLIDHPADPGCSGSADTSEYRGNACDNGTDDDGDGFIDFPNDPACRDLTWVTEFGDGCVDDDREDQDDDASVQIPLHAPEQGVICPGDVDRLSFQPQPIDAGAAVYIVFQFDPNEGDLVLDVMSYGCALPGIGCGPFVLRSISAPTSEDGVLVNLPDASLRGVVIRGATFDEGGAYTVEFK